MTRMERPTATIGAFLAAPSGDAPVAFAEEGVGPAWPPTAASPRTRAR